ncbi:hypothetical protein FF38_00758 [Lucilia cuprina]|uniref:C-type lectin domain-containing protein n=1 Tax=Lucilia cuprina TaxID=7375 RepID=A0A0L0BTN0_LUCCU|nr:E-selectin [Lucilia cuprina]KNC23387.1 hypothetical protein FF38_00758 [Lucilia cuprina]
MNSLVKVVSLTLSVIVFNVLLNVEAQSGTSVILGNKQYYIETTEQVGFYEASNNCAKLSMTLVSIENKTEHDKLKNFLQISELSNDYWLGGNSYGSSSSPVYSWLGTGKRIGFWPATPLSTADKCVFIDSGFTYNDASACTDDKYYICDKPIEPACGKYGQCRYSFSSYSS